jgi:hypothetical protein
MFLIFIWYFFISLILQAFAMLFLSLQGFSSISLYLCVSFKCTKINTQGWKLFLWLPCIPIMSPGQPWNMCIFSYYGGKVFILFEDSGKTQMVIPEGSPFQPCVNSHEIAIIWNVNFSVWFAADLQDPFRRSFFAPTMRAQKRNHQNNEPLSHAQGHAQKSVGKLSFSSPLYKTPVSFLPIFYCPSKTLQYMVRKKRETFPPREELSFVCGGEGELEKEQRDILFGA